MLFRLFRKRVKLDFSGMGLPTQPGEFKTATKICNHKGGSTPEFIAETFFCLGGIAGLKSGCSKPDEAETFLKQLELKMKEAVDDSKEQGNHNQGSWGMF